MPSQKELIAELAALKAENEKLKASRSGGTMTLKVGELGSTPDNPNPGTDVYNIRIHGFGQRPFTMYANQVIRIFSPEGVKMMRELIETCITEGVPEDNQKYGHEEQLTWKNGEPAIEDLPWNVRKKVKA